MLSVFFKKVHTLFSGCNILHFAKRKAIVGLVLGIAALYICAHFYGSLRLGAIFALGFVLIGAVKFDYKKRSRETILHIVWSLVCLFIICYISLEFLDTSFAKELPAKLLLLNFLCCFVLYSFLLAVTGHSSLALIITAVIILCLSTINGFVYLFRGKELYATDIFSARTALNVASQYSYNIPPHVGTRYIVTALVLFCHFSLPDLKTLSFHPRIKWFLATILSILLLTFASKGANVITYDLEGSKYHGFIYNFYLSLKTPRATAPDGYLPKKIDEISQNFPESETVNASPNVIVVMNEAFSDFSPYSNLPSYSNFPYKFISSLDENTIKGSALVSVFGGGTANSEFEFLTGHNMAFFPDPINTIPYQQYIHSRVYCLPWLMSSLGYDTLATHPYLASGWSRQSVYPLFGFDRATFIEDYSSVKSGEGYVNDKEMYSYILDKLYSKKSDSPLFLFGVTMQNHSPFLYSDSVSLDSVELTDHSDKYPITERYLALINLSDEAVEYLLTELEKFPEDTIVLFFGDHMPKIEDEFYALLNGGTPDTLDEQMLKYTVPFFIWANYDIEEYTLEQTSLNYLAGHLLDAAGIELPPYYQFLRDTEQIIPAINAFGYYSKSQGCMIPLEEAEGEEAEAIRNYRYVQYNNMFDADNRNELFFGQYLPD